MQRFDPGFPILEETLDVLATKNQMLTSELASSQVFSPPYERANLGAFRRKPYGTFLATLVWKQLSHEHTQALN